MGFGRSVVINGDLGSGKSTVARLLATQLDVRRISVGELYREMARQRGLTALELNLHAALDDQIDFYVDQLQRDLAASRERVVMDSRLAWFFFADAFKVHLVTDPTVAAARVLARPVEAAESYGSLAEAQARLAERGESERVRFLERYGADKTRLRNYDLVCDSTTATPAELATHIVAALLDDAPGPVLLLDPRRIDTVAEGDLADDDPDGALRVLVEGPRFVAVSGRGAVEAALTRDESLVRATLLDDR